MTYEEYLSTKPVRHKSNGIDTQSNVAELKDWQKAVTDHALRLGVMGMFEECGLGKTLQQMAWSAEVAKQSRRPVFILAPLAVAPQTKREGVKFGVDINICEMDVDIKPGINITNYEKLSKFDTSKFAGVVLDESSILKAYMGKTKRMICEKFAKTPYKLAATATPAPNDLMELLNHAEFLGVMKSSEALSIWFIADQSQSGRYVLKGHAEKDFWQWVASWSVCIEKPSDIGYSDEGYILPPLHEFDDVLTVSELNDDLTQGFFRQVDLSATGFYKERNRTTELRASRCAEIAKSSNEQYLIWCGTNQEADALKKRIPDAIEVRGNDKAEFKERSALDFADGNIRVLISKPSIFGYGLNFQNCHNDIYCGMGYYFENYYQSVRRLHRFGQQKDVHIWRVMGSTEKGILDVISRKQRQKEQMQVGMAQHMKGFQTMALHQNSYHMNFSKSKIQYPAWIRSESA
ncbi:MAG: SNF2-related protein [Oscillospiraceae bacterium]